MPVHHAKLRDTLNGLRLVLRYFNICSHQRQNEYIGSRHQHLLNENGLPPSAPIHLMGATRCTHAIVVQPLSPPPPNHERHTYFSMVSGPSFAGRS